MMVYGYGMSDKKSKKENNGLDGGVQLTANEEIIGVGGNSREETDDGLEPLATACI